MELTHQRVADVLAGPDRVGGEEQRREERTLEPPANPTPSPASVTAIILTYNEELHIERCLRRVAPLAERIVVVDSYSTDRTVEIARAFGAEVLQHPFANQAQQFQWALDSLRITTEWVLKLDADEYLEEPVLDELRHRLPTLSAEVTGIELKLKVLFQGQWIRHGRYYSTVLLRLFRTGTGAVEQRWMDEHVVLLRGRAERITSGDLVDDNLNDLTWWIDKHNRYSTRHMVDFINRDVGLFPEDPRLCASGTAARRKRFLKNNVYGKTPPMLRAILFFVYRYVIRLGFLDGRMGLVFHFMHGFWLMMLIDAKIAEARSFIKTNGRDTFKAYLAARHRIEL